MKEVVKQRAFVAVFDRVALFHPTATGSSLAGNLGRIY
jgi:hypothetical protein